MTYRQVAVISAIAASALLLAGCSSASNTPSSSSSSKDSAKVAAVLKTLGNPFWASMQDGLNAQSKTTGVSVNVQAASDEAGADQQSTLMQTLIGGDYTCFIAAPITATNLIQPLVTASQAKKTIVNVDSAIDTTAAKAAGVTIATFIASNSADAGKQAGAEMVKLLGGKGTVAIIAGLSGDANSNARTGGFSDAAKAGGLTVVQTQNADWDAQKALDAATTILQAHPDLGGFYSANDGMAIGVEKAVKNSGLKTKVIGTDGDKDAIQSIADGGITATIAQYPYAEGILSLDACRAAASGSKLPAKVNAPIALITSDNVQKALSSYPKPFDSYTNPFTALIK